MIARTILGGAVALPLLFAGPALALTGGQEQAPIRPVAFDLPGVFGARKDAGSYRVAQNGDPRITQLEELVRQLNGRVEELNFQILQMQEQMRKQNEDIEFRFQQIEQKKGDASTGGRTVAAVPAGDDAPAAPPRPAKPTTAAASDDDQPAVTAPADGGTKTLGSIVFDKSGVPTGGSVIDPGANATGGGQATMASLPRAGDPEELYRNSYELILSGDYGSAEAGFREHIDRFPTDQRAADAHFWLGESLLGQEKYRDAAEVFLAANKSYPKSKKAPDMLLKLGISLSALNQRDVACATYAEIGRRYPNASGPLKERVRQEQSLAGC